MLKSQTGFGVQGFGLPRSQMSMPTSSRGSSSLAGRGPARAYCIGALALGPRRVHVEIARLLLVTGVDKDLLDHCGTAALMFTCQSMLRRGVCWSKIHPPYFLELEAWRGPWAHGVQNILKNSATVPQKSHAAAFLLQHVLGPRVSSQEGACVWPTGSQNGGASERAQRARENRHFLWGGGRCGREIHTPYFSELEAWRGPLARRVQDILQNSVTVAAKSPAAGFLLERVVGRRAKVLFSGWGLACGRWVRSMEGLLKVANWPREIGSFFGVKEVCWSKIHPPYFLGTRGVAGSVGAWRAKHPQKLGNCPTKVACR